MNKESVNKFANKFLVVFLFILVSIGMPRLIELIDRDAELANNTNALIAVNQSLLDNLQVYDAGNKNVEIKNSDLAILTVNNNLIKRKAEIENRLYFLKYKIQNGKCANIKNGECVISKVDKENKESIKDNKEQKIEGGESWCSALGICGVETKSSILLLAPLIFFTALAGAILHFLLDIQKNGRGDSECNQVDGDGVLYKILMHLVSGLGVAVICTLVFTVGTGEVSGVEKQTPELIGFFSKFGITVKVLLSFLAGMYMNEIYQVIGNMISKALLKFGVKPN